VDHKTNPAIKIMEITCRPTLGGAPSCWNHSFNLVYRGNTFSKSGTAFCDKLR